MARTLSKVVGSKGSGRRRSRLLLLSLALIAAMAVAIPGALAVHDTGAFQLDGNAQTSVQSPVPANDDWDRVCREVLGFDCSTTDVTTGATAVSWSEDNLLNGTPSLDATIFTGGGSKDPIDIDQWAWKDGSGGLPDKANLLHSFAARYSLPDSPECPSGPAPTCEVLFFGSDRYDNSGDAVQGFWFFQNEITLGTQKLGGGFNFNGVHRNGDLLVISEFSNGGVRSTIFVYQWNDTVSGNLELLASSEAANCAQVGPNDAFCGIVNSQNGTVAPWPFLDKSGNNTYLQGEFFEAGINLSTLGLADRCFASVASETRTSTSTTSVLKDFVLGSFGECETELVTTPQTSDGVDIPDTGVSIGSGSVEVQDSAMLDVKGIPTWTGTLSFYLCGPADLDDPGTLPNGDPDDPDTCDIGGTLISSGTVNNTTPQPIVSDTATVTAAGDYCWRGFFDADTEGVPDATDASDGECFTVNPVTPEIETEVAAAAVELGSSISDSATLSGTADQPGDPVINPTSQLAAGGEITFVVYGPNDDTCTGTAIPAGSAAVSGDGTYFSASITPTEPGTYRWIASYDGDSPNTNPVSGACNDANETVVVSKTELVTTPTDDAGVALMDSDGDSLPDTLAGSMVRDSATLVVTGLATWSGTLSFFLCGPTELDGDDLCGSNGTPVGSGIAVDQDTVQPILSNAVTVTNPGRYCWRGEFVSSTTGVPDDTDASPGECFEVIALQPTMDTAQEFVPNDSATVTVVSGGGDLAGTVVFQLFVNDEFCAGPADYTSGAIDITTGVGNGLSRTVMSDNTTAYLTSSTFHWVVTYTSTNPAHMDVSSGCGNETSSIVIDNGETQPPSGG